MSITPVSSKITIELPSPLYFLSGVLHFVGHGWPNYIIQDLCSTQARVKNFLPKIVSCILWGSWLVVPTQRTGGTPRATPEHVPDEITLKNVNLVARAR